MLIKKENGRYFASGGLQWYGLPENLKTKQDLNKYYGERILKDPLQYSTDDFKPAKRFDVEWFNNRFPCAVEDEDRTRRYHLDLPPGATDEQIIDCLRQRAKEVFNMEPLIIMPDKRPDMLE
jgi:hypothetical protein